MEQSATPAKTSKHATWRSPHPSPGIAVSDIGKVLDVAAELIADVGIAKFSMQDLADRVGIAKPTLYAYVGNKSFLLEGIFDRVIAHAEDFVAEARTTPTPAERLDTLIELWTRGSVLDVSYYRVYFGCEHELSEEARARMRRRLAALFADIRDLIAEGQKAGVFDSTLDPKVMTFAIVWMCTGAGNWFSSDDRLTWEQVADQFVRLIRGGLLRKK
jgi:AcrR family transcriptional regulator